MRSLPPLCLVGAVLLAACQPVAPAATARPSGKPPGLAFAQGSCGGCHAVERGQLSPNPEAPPFPAIVNRPDLTHETLSSWLRDAHNYPEEMEFWLESPEVADLVAYMLSLRDERYRPPI